MKHSTIEQLPSNVQQILPLLINLDMQQRFALVHYLTQLPPYDNDGKSNQLNQPNQTNRNEQNRDKPNPIAPNRLGRHQGQMSMQPDFQQDLSDEFWFDKG